jgi:hypothetical protein
VSFNVDDNELREALKEFTSGPHEGFVSWAKLHTLLGLIVARLTYDDRKEGKTC